MSALDVRPAGAAVKLRRPWMVGALSLIPFYWPCWYYLVNREMRDFGRARGDAALGASRPVRSVLAVTLGSLVVVPALVSEWRAVRRLEACERVGGAARASAAPILWAAGAAYVLSCAGFLADTGAAAATLIVVAQLAFIAATVMAQHRLTTLWRALGEPDSPDFGAD